MGSTFDNQVQWKPDNGLTRIPSNFEPIMRWSQLTDFNLVMMVQNIASKASQLLRLNRLTDAPIIRFLLYQITELRFYN